MGIISLVDHSERTPTVKKYQEMKFYALISSVLFGFSSAGASCMDCISTNGFNMDACQANCAFDVMSFDGTSHATQKRAGSSLKSLCLRNPRALPCMRALRNLGTTNLMW